MASPLARSRQRRSQSAISIALSKSKSSSAMKAASGACLLSSAWMCNGFSLNNGAIQSRTQIITIAPISSAPSPRSLSFTRYHKRHNRSIAPPLRVYAPPGSGYVGPDPDFEDDPYLTPSDMKLISPSAFPDTYEPMLEYPGTMRPGRTPENMPYHDLPGLGIDDPNPVPWPHFQEIEWHHMWDPPHEQALAMEEFIEMEGRWASVEEEAAMRMGMRRGVRERREQEETGSGDNAMVIMDDDDEDEADAPTMLGLGEGVEAFIGGRDEVVTKAITKSAQVEEEDDEEEEDEDDDSDDFLLDLGLGGDVDDEEEEEEKPSRAKLTPKMKVEDDGDDDGDDDLDLDFQLGFDLDDDDDEDGGFDDLDDEDDEDDDADFIEDDEDPTIEDLNARDDGGDDDEFDDGGFDYDTD